MRTPRNDGPLTAGTPPAVRGRGAQEPERRCILSGEHDARVALLRLALSPDGDVVPDVMARAPGRGAWIGVDRPALENAMAKGKLKGAMARAFKGARVAIPDDLPDRIEAAFSRAFLSQIGLAAKAGVLLTGAEKVDAAARAGAVALLAHASDAADDGRRKRDQSWRVGEDAEGSAMAGTPPGPAAAGTGGRGCCLQGNARSESVRFRSGLPGDTRAQPTPASPR